MADATTSRAVEAVVRMESARVIAGLARLTGDVGLAEELAQDAVVAALEQWPESGVPRNPGAWLMTVAKRRAIDLFRRNRTLESRYAEIGRALERAADGPIPSSSASWPRTSTTTCCGWSSWPATRCCPCRRGSP